MSLPPTLPPVALIIASGTPAFQRVLTEAFSAAFPEGNIVTVGGAVAATSLPPQASVELVALLDPSASEAEAASTAVDAVQLPRWGTLTFTSGAAPEPASGNLFALRDWSGVTLRTLLQGAVTLQQLRHEHARARGELLSIGTRVVHDLRSPLGGILTTAEVIREILQDEVPTQAALTEPLIESTDGLTKLIRQLSTFAKATAGQSPKTRLNMTTPFWAAFQQVEREALKVGATIRYSATWPEVEGDPSWLEAMWHGLLCNSLQHAGPSPQIEAGWNRIAGENRFWLVDGGRIPAEKRASLFTPFHLLHRPNAPRGLGLPIVRRLAELQGGRCGYEQLSDEGSCFFFTLPVIETGATTAPSGS